MIRLMDNGGRLVWSLPVVVVAGLLAVALHGTSPAAPAELASDAAARALLADTWELARRGDPAPLCAGEPVCLDDWAEYGGARNVPAELPRVARSTARHGHRWLRLCGTRPDGRSYETDFVVLAGRNGFDVLTPMFWGRRTYSGVYASGGQPPPTGDVPRLVCS